MNTEEAVNSFEYGGFVGLLKMGTVTKYISFEIKEMIGKEELIDVFKYTAIQLGISLDRGDFND